jgi:hypothetical protein
MADGSRRVLVTLDASTLAAVERFRLSEQARERILCPHCGGTVSEKPGAPSMDATLRRLVEIALAKREIRS